jgi:hypothetical protein
LLEAAMLEVFRFALFAVRTFFGVILLMLGLYAALWVFVKVRISAIVDAGFSGIADGVSS